MPHISLCLSSSVSCAYGNRNSRSGERRKPVSKRQLGVSGAGTGVTPKGKKPECACARDDQSGGQEKVHDAGPWILETAGQNAGGDVGDEDHRDDPAEDQLEHSSKNRVGRPADVEDIEVSVDQLSLIHI